MVLGVRFLDGDVGVILEHAKDGGLVVVPSGPGLATLPHDLAYRQALEASDLAIVDSAFLALLWWFVARRRLHRVSGLALLRAFFARGIGRTRGALFLVNPSDEDGVVNRRWLTNHGYDLPQSHCYTAPKYIPGAVEDPALIRVLDELRPAYVMLNIGGGIQEPLGCYLKRTLSYRPTILCTGAAIAFLTGRQARIPTAVDRFGLGWLARCISEPSRFVPRYLEAFRLAPLVLRHQREMPPRRSS